MAVTKYIFLYNCIFNLADYEWDIVYVNINVPMYSYNIQILET